MKTERVEWEVQRHGNERWVQYFVTDQEEEAIAVRAAAELTSSMPTRIIERTISERVIE